MILLCRVKFKYAQKNISMKRYWMKRKYQGYSTNFMEYRSQNFNQLSIITNGITKEIIMYAVLRIDMLFQQNNK